MENHKRPSIFLHVECGFVGVRTGILGCLDAIDALAMYNGNLRLVNKYTFLASLNPQIFPPE